VARAVRGIHRVGGVVGSGGLQVVHADLAAVGALDEVVGRVGESERPNFQARDASECHQVRAPAPCVLARPPLPAQPGDQAAAPDLQPLDTGGIRDEVSVGPLVGGSFRVAVASQHRKRAGDVQLGIRAVDAQRATGV
jgi:hypothetical protein